MPFYAFICRQCGQRREAVASVEGLPELENSMNCFNCGLKMDYDWSRSYASKPFPEFVTENVDGKPMRIASLSELRRVEREHGVNFPAFGGTMLKDIDASQTRTWIDSQGRTRRD